jgi:sortase (surface protein transpeptidase)
MPRSPLTRLVAPALVALSIVIQASAPALAFVPSSAEAPETPAPVTTPAVEHVGESPAVATTAAGRATRSRSSIVKSVAAEWASASRQRAQAVKVKPAAKSKPTSTPQTRTASISYHGRNHVWIPSLGVSRSVVFFSCSDTGVANYVYRWGCAGHNNVYLFGHASSVFKPLHDAYTHHRLSRGMKVVYADGGGRVRAYRVTFWKVVSPTNGAWAYAGQSRPSMTLQTCVGANSAYRLIVRLVQS